MHFGYFAANMEHWNRINHYRQCWWRNVYLDGIRAKRTFSDSASTGVMMSGTGTDAISYVCVGN